MVTAGKGRLTVNSNFLEQKKTMKNDLMRCLTGKQFRRSNFGIIVISDPSFYLYRYHKMISA